MTLLYMFERLSVGLLLSHVVIIGQGDDLNGRRSGISLLEMVAWMVESRELIKRDGRPNGFQPFRINYET